VETEVFPGDIVNIKVQLKPFRDEPVSRIVPFTVPKDSKPGSLLLEVRGGGMISLTSFLLKMQGLDELLKPAKSKQKSLQDLVTELRDRDRNNDIVVEMGNVEQDALLAAPDPLPGSTRKIPIPSSPKVAAQNPLSGAGKSAVKFSGKTEEAKPVKFHITTDYIIDSGDAQVAIMVKAPTR
jgi:hypothetical protein